MRQLLTLFFSLILIVGLFGAALRLAPPLNTASLTSTTPSGSSPTITPPSNYRYAAVQLNTLPQEVNFTYQGVATGVTAEIQLVKPYVAGPTGPDPDTAYPTHLRFYFYSDSASTPPTRVVWQPQLRIYPVKDYRLSYGTDSLEQVNTPTYMINQTIDLLKDYLAVRPYPIPDTIPFLPPMHDAQVFKSQIKYLDFSGGSGIRFITQHALGGPISNQDIFYTFQGLTADGQYYIALFYPVSTPALASIAEDQALETPEDYRRHVEETTQRLDALSSGNFTPDLSLLDELIESLQITAPAEKTASVPMLEPTAPTPTPFGGGTGEIAFISAGNIYLMNTDGSDLTRLTDTGGIGCFVWSPDGRKIAFSDPDDNLALIDTSGENVTKLSIPLSSFGQIPAWQPAIKRSDK